MSELMLSAEALVVPSCVLSKAHAFDMRKIHRAESRIVELNVLSHDKAGELVATFIDAFGDAKEHYAVLQGLFATAKQKLRSARGLIVLDKAPDLLKEKGLASSRSPAGSEDLRDGVVNTDVEYLRIADILAQTEVAMNRMEAKVEKLKMAYFAASSYLKPQLEQKRNFSGGAADDEPGALSHDEKIKQFITDNAKPMPKGFGAAKY